MTAECTCENGHAILCSVHAEEAMELMRKLAEEVRGDE